MRQNLETYRILLFLACFCIGSFFVWASMTEIDQQVNGVGRVITSGKVRAIQHLEDAIVREIRVEEGSPVAPGDILFQLVNTRAEAEMKEIAVALDALKIRRARLELEKEEREEFVLEASDFGERSGIIESELNLFKARQAEIQEKLDGYKKRMRQKLLKLDDLESAASNLKKERSVALEQLSIKRQLFSSGAISRSQYLEAESKVKNFDTRISRVTKEIPIVKSEISEAENLLEETRQNWRSKVAEELNNVNVDIKKLGERIVKFSDAVSRTALRSPIKGVVNKLHVNTVGGVIHSGQVLAEIIPLEEALLVEGQIATEDRGKIWEGLPVAAIISAYDYSTYGSLKGRLTHISADSFVDQQGKGYYQVRVMLENTEVAKDKPILPGMTVDINILAGKISVLRALMKPLDQIRENALREL